MAAKGAAGTAVASSVLVLALLGKCSVDVYLTAVVVPVMTFLGIHSTIATNNANTAANNAANKDT